MERTLTTEIGQHVGERVKLAGWLHRLRRLGGVNFLILRDRAGLAQIVLEDVSPLAHVSPESVIQVQGLVVKEPQAPGGYELHDAQVEVISPVTEALPFPIHKPRLKVNLDTFLEHPIIGLRHPSRRALFRLAAGVMAGFRSTLDALGFTEIQTPKLVGAATEGGANVFQVDYFGRPAYLAQSPQLYKQMMVTVFERVYEVGPVFRAEPHDTTRHINEYVSLDVEMGFIQDHRDVMAVAEQVVHGILDRLRRYHALELAELGVTLPKAPTRFPSIYFPDAQQLIYERWGDDCRGDPDLAPQHERWLGEWARETYDSEFLFVTGYPLSKRPFYTHPNPADPRYSNSFDLLFRGMELITGGQRLHRYEDYLQAAETRGISLEALQGYLEAFRYGAPPHGGFAIGLERFLMQLLGLSNIREATLFPRDLKRLTP
ncbi:MAG: aspartate--tRNA(Asn) ligase [Anaerolineae bacterium]|nr:aspartate--tRNA(Asn) ligase [Anaerolineae bacterium]